MISISKLGGSASAASYYDKADYYTKGEDSVDVSSRFTGGLAKEFDLDGPVDKKVFKELLDGKMPNGQKLGTMRNGKKEHTPGWDLTLSAPKSVSILALVGGDKSVLKAHHEAVGKALEYVEKEALKGRMNTSFYKGNIDLDKALFAQFTHTTSRKLDPQLHTHSVLVNAGMDKSGELRSIDSRRFYEASMLTGQIYRNELASSLKKLGYAVEWDAKSGLFEVAGVSKELIDNFSKRRVEITEIAKELGIEGAKGLDAVTVASRETKQDVDSKDVIRSWDEQTKSMDLDPDKLVQEAKQKGKDHDKPSWGAYIKEKFIPHSTLDQTVQDAVSQLAHYESAFDKKDVLIQALRFGGGRYSYSDINKTLNSFIKNKSILSSKSVDGMLTTPEIV
ncbi:MAG: MobF family relaxase, partial [Colwellia sp.]